MEPTKIDLPPGIERNQLGAYTAATLQIDERPLHQTTIHWIALTGAVIGSVLSLIVIVPIAMFAAWRDFYWAWLLLVIPMGMLASVAITIKTSELVITDRRVLIKVGFIQRHTLKCSSRRLSRSLSFKACSAASSTTAPSRSAELEDLQKPLRPSPHPCRFGTRSS